MNEHLTKAYTRALATLMETTVARLLHLSNELLDFRGTLAQLNAELDRAGLPMFTLNHHSTIIGKMAKIRGYSEFSIENGLLASPLIVVNPNDRAALERVLNP